MNSALSHRKNVNSKIVTFNIKLDEPAKSFDIKAWVVESLNLPKVQYDINDMKRKFSHLANITFPEFKEDEVTLLIGTNYTAYFFIEIAVKGE